jgi:K+-sensing histidine kinase KdpD
MARPNLQLQLARSPVLRYGLAATSFAIALGLALLAQHYGFHNVEGPLFLFAVAVTAWYPGLGPAVLAAALAIAFFDYFFTEPRYTFYVRSAALPYRIVFASFASLVGWFSGEPRLKISGSSDLQDP